MPLSTSSTKDTYTYSKMKSDSAEDEVQPLQIGETAGREDAQFGGDVGQHGVKSYSFIDGGKAMLLTGPMNVLLVATPVAFVSYYSDWPMACTFILSLLALAPLAERLGFVTEQLALHTNDTIGGLLNASFGNATELIVAIQALRQGLYRVVQLSLLGSVLSNLLLVMGCAFYFGGLKYKIQHYNPISAQVNSSLLMLATMGLVFPSLMRLAGEDTTNADLGLSRAISMFLLFAYVLFLIFQLHTHKDVYNSDATNAANAAKKKNDDLELTGGNDGVIATDDEEEEEEEEEDILGWHYSIVWLTIITAFISFLSEFIVDTIQAAGKSYNISGIFLSTIVLPIVGNAAEHASAVTFALKNKVDISLGVAIGSSTQIAVFVLPLVVVVGWIIDKPMTLNFNLFEGFTMFLTVVVTTFATASGTSNWLLGVILILAYLIISAGFLARTDQPLDAGH